MRGWPCVWGACRKRDNKPMSTRTALPAHVIADTVRWLERAVIGLNLCPFAKAPHVKGRIHYAVSAATDVDRLSEIGRAHV